MLLFGMFSASESTEEPFGASLAMLVPPSLSLVEQTKERSEKFPQLLVKNTIVKVRDNRPTFLNNCFFES
jgi:hypothetical protein